ncbi:MAG: exopolysaccharide biosynthesis operon protein EpsL [Candidatus Paceibacteria bacterium]|jgi:exopolysaccharide biosynthesis operon protein EpsL
MLRLSSPALIPLPLLAPLTMAVCALFCTNAVANPEDVFQPYVGLSYAHNDNVYGLSSAEQGRALGIDSLADTYRVMSAGINIDKQISQQHLIANLGLSRSNYDRFTQLDNDGKNALVKLDWQIGSRITGNIGASYAEALSPDRGFVTQERNLRTQKQVFFDGAWRFHPSWQVRGKMTRDQLAYALESQRANDRNVNAEEIGIDYLSAGSGSIGLQAGHSTGAYKFPELVGQFNQFRIGNDYSQNEFKGKIDWIASGKTRLQFLGGWVERKHAAFTDRDFSGPNARLIANYALTSKIALTANVYREIGSVDDTTASFTLNNGVSLGSTWDLTSKVQLSANASTVKRKYDGTPALPTLQLSTRSDSYRNISVGANYIPTRKWSISLNAYRTEQSTNFQQGNFTSNGVTLSTRYAF